MKSTCITHPEKEPLIIIRKWQLEACGGNACAAALLSFFEYWHNIRLDQAIKAAQTSEKTKDDSLDGDQEATFTQYHNTKSLEDGILIYKKDAIKTAIDLLVTKDFISVHRNPNPRYRYDQTRHFLFHSETVNEWLDKRKADKQKQTEEVESPNGEAQKASRKSANGKEDNRSPSAENLATSTEIINNKTASSSKRVHVSKKLFPNSSRKGKVEVPDTSTVRTVHNRKSKKIAEKFSENDEKVARNNDDVTVTSQKEAEIPTKAELRKHPLFAALSKICNSHYDRLQPANKMRFAAALGKLHEGEVTEDALLAFGRMWQYYWRCTTNGGRSPYPLEVPEVWDEVMGHHQ